MAQHVTTQASPGVVWRTATPLRYYSNPWLLFFTDFALFFKDINYLPLIVWPLSPSLSGSLDELSLTAANLFDMCVHLVLFVSQLGFLLSIFCSFFWFIPIGFVLVYTAVFLAVSYLLCKILLNGNKATLMSKADLSHFPDRHEDEMWIFVNGIGAGKHWLQSEIDRLSLTFARPVLGVHNPTFGIVFDFIQSVFQRDFTYVSVDIRNIYAEVKKALANPQYKTVVLILHSQGGIEGGLVLDWLLASVPAMVAAKLEIYTFASAANHFNNPLRGPPNTAGTVEPGSHAALPNQRAFRHIEHYANSKDFVSRFGVLHFASHNVSAGSRYMGRIFERDGTGHILNQHFLDTMFPLDTKRGYGVLEHNSFVDAKVQIAGSCGQRNCTTCSTPVDAPNSHQRVIMRNANSRFTSVLSPTTCPSTQTVGQLSRLWAYRNGRVPEDP